ncbi:hypothetical protein B0T26DRAFT_131312 [Lasiosphaeria miniovina]|uniref:Uncharacterized protein n=1 Tax=Lasiosphaeria miniovina TaxID=1954250 RepID=A0AA40E700_9PEZI|nr:uncharacterized protein B0T26DRAFT_131312 [Lasiosphaeria miniovina]KAK0727342.1 hypothetical protein B0T26DRAFT_131312 [Lasiosphaeria miniovina]
MGLPTRHWSGLQKRPGQLIAPLQILRIASRYLPMYIKLLGTTLGMFTALRFPEKVSPFRGSALSKQQYRSRELRNDQSRDD